MKIIKQNIAFLATLTLNELALAYDLQLKTIGDIEVLFDYIKNDIENEGFRFIYANNMEEWKYG